MEKRAMFYVRVGSKSAGFILPDERKAYNAFMDSLKEKTAEGETKDTVLYCRTANSSTDINELQLDMLRRYGHKMGYASCTEYCDWNESGLTLNRPNMQKLLTAIRARNVKQIIVKDFPRLTRNMMHAQELICLFHEYDVELVSINDKIAVYSGESTQLCKLITEFTKQKRRRRQCSPPSLTANAE